MGGDEPIVVQSMTTSDTMKIEETVQQAKDLADAGCDIVRITAPTVDDAEALKEIKARLVSAGYSVPLVADIHFLPPAAMIAAEYVEKVRINPGNFADRKMFKVREYTEGDYTEELKRIEEKFTPLVLKLKQKNRTLRIGTNHGSLSDRIMNRFGDTPEGMVQSAFEYAEICRKNDFHNFVFSMKASNVGVMVHAYRLLVQRQLERAWDYPIHLGVTEAGEGEDARIKSSVGIGTLLAEGIGDTVRVSLTEASVKEIPVARALAASFPKTETPWTPGFSLQAGAKNASRHRVWFEMTGEVNPMEWRKTSLRPDVYFFSQTSLANQRSPKEWRTQIKSFLGGEEQLLAIRYEPSLSEEWLNEADFIVGSKIPEAYTAKTIQLIEAPFQLKTASAVDPERTVILAQPGKRATSELQRLIDVSVRAGSAFLDAGFAGILVSQVTLLEGMSLAFGVLQATRRRMEKTEYIACPSCGRTLFNLEETTARIKGVTSHLKGVKIAVMGCIVNGPGEMADADFGYVGGAPGKVNLYVQKDCVERNISSEEAPGRLVELIKKHGRWVEPTTAAV
jgi:(E)-4-hydroxy-3-methylbut-2-enyl-diphosphate synthase